MRKLAKTLALVGMLHPLQVAALGVGDIRLRSALNQPFNAEIPLVLSGSDALDDVKVKLAAPEAFNKAGVERSFFLTQLRFVPERKPDGSYVVHVRSSDVVREPFLSFVIEVNWPQGRVFREFTVLLDPPATFPEATPYSRQAPRIGPRERPDYASQEYQPSPPEITQVPTRQAETVPIRYTGAEYGPVQRDETLWSIAGLLNHDSSISQQQMVTALFRANRGAFSGGVNTLKAGATLKVPDRESILQLTGGRAIGQASRKGRTGISEPVPAQVSGTAESRGQLRLLNETDSKTKAGVGGAGSEGAQGKAKSDLALEVAETVRQENDEFRSRLMQLEQRLSEMQRLLTVRDEQIAALQAQQAGKALVPTVPAPTVTPVAEMPKPELQPSPAVGQPPVPRPVIPSPMPPESKAPAFDTGTVPPTPVAPVPEAPQPPQVAQPGPTKSITATSPPVARRQPAPAAQKPEPEAPGLLDELMKQPLYLVIGGVVVLLLAWTIIVLARRRAAMIEETESILIATEKESQLRAQLAAARLSAPAREQVSGARNSFISEFTPSDFDALGAETDEVDPISEADVYLAYGRYKQAEELIRSAITQHPERDECKLKLFEIHYATENRVAFEHYAHELKDMGKEMQPEFWDKVAEMGRELMPDNPLFTVMTPARKKVPAAPEASNVLGSLDLSDDLIDDLKRFEIEITEPVETDHDFLERVDSVMSFSGGSSSSPARFVPSSPPAPAPPEPATPLPEEEPAGLDFDFSSFDFARSSKPPTPLKTAVEEPEELENLIAFDLSNPKASAPSPSLSTKVPQPPGEKTLEEILRELDSTSGEPELPEAEAGTSDRTALEMPSFDFEGLSFDAEPGQLPHSEEEAEYGASLSDLSMADEWETKLDLAKAYSDMEDEESAREILEEVLLRGSERQKAEARGLLAKFSGSSMPRI